MDKKNNNNYLLKNYNAIKKELKNKKLDEQKKITYKILLERLKIDLKQKQNYGGS